MNQQRTEEKPRRRTLLAGVITAALVAGAGTTGFVLHTNHQASQRAERAAEAGVLLVGACLAQTEALSNLHAKQAAAGELVTLVDGNVDAIALQAAIEAAELLDAADCFTDVEDDADYLTTRKTAVETRTGELAVTLGVLMDEYQAVRDTWQAHLAEQAAAEQAAALAAAQAALDAARAAGEAIYADSYGLVDDNDVRRALGDALDVYPGDSPSRTQAYAWIIEARADDVQDAMQVRADRLAAEAATRPPTSRPGTGNDGGAGSAAGGGESGGGGSGGGGSSGGAGGGQPAPPAGGGGHQQPPPAPPQEQAPPPAAQEPCVCVEWAWNAPGACYRWNRNGC
ncbi:MAG: hypothetical protein FWG11_04300 [Promicromonosporaceae bacterium]|nr:hypothetical protein [Promicromonosporaceae bacterium]